MTQVSPYTDLAKGARHERATGQTRSSSANAFSRAQSGEGCWHAGQERGGRRWNE